MAKTMTEVMSKGSYNKKAQAGKDTTKKMQKSGKS